MKYKEIYENRFDENERNRKNEMWRILCEHFFQKYISVNDCVLDVGAGYCEFINNINCKEKIALDLNEDTEKYANHDVKVYKYPSTDMGFIDRDSVDIVFMSNFLEHLQDKNDVLKTFGEVYKILKKGGKILILQPNIRYLYKEYWDFFDHNVAISDKSLVEALELSGFNINEIISKFMPYTTKSRLPQSGLMITMYLKIPLAWKLLGKQCFVVASK